MLATVPSDVFEQLLEPGLLPEAYLAQLRGIEYFTALCLLLELDRQFSPFYWTNIADHELPFVGLIEHTNLIEPERYDGRRFLYVANYLAARPRAARRSTPTRCSSATRPVCARSTRRFDRVWVKQLWLHREPAAQPIVTVGYRERIPPLKTAVPRARARQHDADLSRGPRHQLRGAARRRGGESDAR